MDISQWRQMAVRSVVMLAFILMIGMISFLDNSEMPEHTVHAQNQEEMLLEHFVQPTPERQEATASGEKEAVNVSERYIKINKPDDGQALEAYLENDYMDFSITLTLKGETAGEYTVAEVYRCYKGESFVGDWQQGNDMVKKIVVSPLEQKNQETVSIRMQLSDVYEPVLFDTPEAYYISLEKPEEIFEHIVVLDAGHGGCDEGAISLDGKYHEKDLNLCIVNYLKELFDKDSSVKVYYTRLGDREVSKAKRVRLANAVHADVFVSVHCNASDPGETTANGIEALYSTRKAASSEDISSKQLSQRVLVQLCAVTGRRARKVIQRNGLYLMNHSRVPVTIIEVGYLSNSSDLQYLLRAKNQKKIGQGIYQGIYQALNKTGG